MSVFGAVRGLAHPASSCTVEDGDIGDERYDVHDKITACIHFSSVALLMLAIEH